MIVFDRDKCISCGICKSVCLPEAITMTQNGPEYTAPEACILCGHCIAACPTYAVANNEMDMGEVEPYDENAFTADPEKLLNLMKFRRSVRAYRPDPIPDAVLDRILAAGRWAPTARNLQRNSFIVIREARKQIEALALGYLKEHGADLMAAKGTPEHERYSRRFGEWNDQFASDSENTDPLFFGAPAVVLVVTNPVLATDAAGCAAYMEIQAAAEGLGCLYSGYFCSAANESAEMRKILGISERKTVVRAMIMGYPAEKYLRTVPRAPLKIKYI